MSVGREPRRTQTILDMKNQYRKGIPVELPPELQEMTLKGTGKGGYAKGRGGGAPEGKGKSKEKGKGKWKDEGHADAAEAS